MNHLDPYRNAKDLASILSLLEYETQWLIKSHTTNNIDDIDGFALQIIAKCLKSLRTLSVICTSCEDYPSANSVLRMVIDSIAVYNIVYANLDIESQSRIFFSSDTDPLNIKCVKICSDFKSKVS